MIDHFHVYMSVCVCLCIITYMCVKLLIYHKYIENEMKGWKNNNGRYLWQVKLWVYQQSVFSKETTNRIYIRYVCVCVYIYLEREERPNLRSWLTQLWGLANQTHGAGQLAGNSDWRLKLYLGAEFLLFLGSLSFYSQDLQLMVLGNFPYLKVN